MTLAARCALAVAVAAAHALLGAEAQHTWNEPTPNPMQDPTACGQRVSSLVCDPDGLLQSTGGLKAALETLTADYEYPGCGGYEMAVVVVRHIRGGTDSDVEAFAKATMDAWRVGKAACNNGIVLAIATEDRQMFIATGRGAAEHLPDRELRAVIARLIPLMREGQVSEACEQAVSDIARLLSGETFAKSWFLENRLVLLCFGGFCLVASWHCLRQGKYNRCKQALTQIEKEHREAMAERYHVVSCAICLETFAETPRLETRLFPCGHTFHSPCVQKWDESHGNCPICRQSTDATLVAAGRPGLLGPRPSAVPPLGAPWPSHEDEYRFRIRRARDLYPDYVSQLCVQRWCAPGHSGMLAADTVFIRASPSYSDNSGGRGGGGSASFGGGCSSGGGGAGGSW